MQVPQKPINISEIPQIRGNFYENIFNVYQTQDDNMFFYYNLGKKIVFDIENVSDEYVEYVYIDAPMPWTTISYRLYGTINLWWLIVSLNNLNPIDIPPANSVFMVIKRDNLQQILNTINQ